MRICATLCLLLITCCTAFAQRYSIYQNISTGNGLPSNYVFGVTEDENGFLWAGTDKGLCYYDGFRWQVRDKDNGLPGNYINTIFSDKRGGLWLGISEKGFYHFVPATNSLQKLYADSLLVARTMQTDDEGNLYAEIHGAQTTGYLFHPANVKKPEVVFSCAGSQSFSFRGDALKKQVIVLFANGVPLRIPQNNFKSKWPVRMLTMDKSFLSQPVYYLSDSILITNSHYLRFSNEGKLVQQQQLFPRNNSYGYARMVRDGLYVYDIKTGYYFFDKKNTSTFFDTTSGLGTSYVNHVYETKDGTVVLSTLGEGLQLIKNRYRKTFYTDNHPVKTILNESNRWYVLADEKIYEVTDTASSLSMLGNTGASALNLFKNEDTLLAGTLRGIRFFKIKNNQLLPAGFVEHNAGISSIIKNKNNYTAGSYGGGLVHFTHEILSIQPDYPFRIVEKVIPVSTGFAALSYEDGLLLTNAVTGKHIKLNQQNGLLSNSVYSIFEQGDKIYIGTKGGVSIYKDGKVVQSLPFPGYYGQEKAIACFLDNANQFWVVSNHLLYQLKENSLRPLASFPLIDDNNIITTASYNAALNEVGIGSNNSFSIVSLNAVKSDTVVEPLRLTEITLNGKVQKSSGFLIPYDFKNVQFTLAPMSVLPFAKMHFYYRLEGLGNEWHEIKDSLKVSFSGLRPGNYALYFKAVNGDGYENKPLKFSSFTVQKPFWMQWYMIALYMAVVSGATVYIVAQIEKAKRRKLEAALLLKQTLQAERERIAKDLHDHLGANLATIIAQTDNIETRMYEGDFEQASHTVQNLSVQTRETMNALRETVWAVQEKEHSLQDFIIRTRSFLQRIFESSGIKWNLTADCDVRLTLSPMQTLHLFRIVQEASQNILKHAGASAAVYNFSCTNNQLKIVIYDNGKGFQVYKGPTNGFVNIKERSRLLGGTVNIHQQPSVKIEIFIPL